MDHCSHSCRTALLFSRLSCRPSWSVRLRECPFPDQEKRRGFCRGFSSLREEGRLGCCSCSLPQRQCCHSFLLSVKVWPFFLAFILYTFFGHALRQLIDLQSYSPSSEFGWHHYIPICRTLLKIEKFQWLNHLKFLFSAHVYHFSLGIGHQLLFPMYL